MLRLVIVQHAVRQRYAGWEHEHDGKSKAGVNASFPTHRGSQTRGACLELRQEDQVVVGEALPFEDLMANGEKVAATVKAPAKT
jgi:hypothetical protein